MVHPALQTNCRRRGIPIFHPDTLVQHYLRPEEMKPFYAQALEDGAARQQLQIQGTPQGTPRNHAGGASTSEAVAAGDSGALGQPGCGGAGGAADPAAALYAQVVAMGLLRR